MQGNDEVNAAFVKVLAERVSALLREGSGLPLHVEVNERLSGAPPGVSAGAARDVVLRRLEAG